MSVNGDTESAIWKPKTGIYCDDLVAIAENDKTQFLFLTEVKGTTLQHGLSHSSEAKMFYQPGHIMQLGGGCLQILLFG
jgi:hypothetical protein